MATFQPFPQLKELTGKKTKNNFGYIKNIINEYESGLDNSILENQEYKCSIAIVPISVDKTNKADYVVHMIPPNS
jgi:hypothetical protein